MRKETVDIVKDLVEGMSFTFTIDNAIDNGDGTFTLEGCNTYHLQPCFAVTIGVQKFVIDSVVNNTSITITGLNGAETLPTETDFTVYPHFYFHGTVIQTNAELSQIDTALKVPMVYALEIVEDRFFNRDSRLERESDLRLFFLSQANFEDWKTKDSYENVIIPMRNLAYNFIDALEDSKIIGTFAEYRLINHSKFGVYVTDKGYSKTVFNDTLGGVEMRITLPIVRVNDCEDFCNN